MLIHSRRRRSLLSAVMLDPDAIGTGTLSDTGVLTAANAALACYLLGQEARADAVLGRHIAEFLPDPATEQLIRRAARSRSRQPLLLNVVSPVTHTSASLKCWTRRAGTSIRIACVPAERAARAHSWELLEVNTELARLARENAEQARELASARDALAEALRELQTSYWHLRRIQEVLPICMGCGDVKTADATWSDLVSFMKAHAGFLSHGYCPDCAREAARAYGLGPED